MAVILLLAGSGSGFFALGFCAFVFDVDITNKVSFFIEVNQLTRLNGSADQLTLGQMNQLLLSSSQALDWSITSFKYSQKKNEQSRIYSIWGLSVPVKEFSTTTLG